MPVIHNKPPLPRPFSLRLNPFLSQRSDAHPHIIANSGCARIDVYSYARTLTKLQYDQIRSRQSVKCIAGKEEVEDREAQ